MKKRNTNIVANLYKSLHNNTYEPSPHEVWAMALSAPCYRDPVASMGLVAGLSTFSFEKPKLYKILIKEFGSAGPQLIPHGRHTMLHEVSEDIFRNPSQAFFQHIRMRLILLGSDAEGWISKLVDDRLRKQAMFIFNNLYLLPIAGIQAWNISRAIYYDRCSLLFGLEGCNTAMGKIMRYAQLAQVLYGSWEDYFTSYAAGAQYMHPDVIMPEGLVDKLEDLIGYICRQEHFGYELSWNLKLGHKLIKANKT